MLSFHLHLDLSIPLFLLLHMCISFLGTCASSWILFPLYHKFNCIFYFEHVYSLRFIIFSCRNLFLKLPSLGSKKPHSSCFSLSFIIIFRNPPSRFTLFSSPWRVDIPRHSTVEILQRVYVCFNPLKVQCSLALCATCFNSL